MIKHHTRDARTLKSCLLVLAGWAFCAASPSPADLMVFGDPGHTATGDWTYVRGAFNEHFQTDPNNGATSEYHFSDLTTDTYHVWANWTAYTNRTTLAQYDISDGGGTTYVNQQIAPGDLWANGTRWALINSAAVTDGDLTVLVSDLDGPFQPGELTYLMSDAIRISPLPFNETTSGALVIDDYYGDGFGVSGSWNFAIDTGYPAAAPSYLWQAAAAGTDTVTYSFTDLPIGTYNVSAIWPPLSNRSLDAVYTISDGGGTKHVDQRNYPNGVLDDGVWWELLHEGVTVTDGTLTVTLSDNDPVGFLIADAVRISTVPYAVLDSGALVVDNGDPSLGFSYAGSFANQGGGFLGDEWYQSDPAAVGDVATYTFTGLDDGVYNVSTIWSPLINRTTDAVYAISDGGGAVHVDQRHYPDGVFDQGIWWELLSEGVVVTDGTLTVTLSDSDPNGFLMADAVRISTTPYHVTPTGAYVVDNGDPSLGFSYTGAFSPQGSGYLGDEWYQSDPAAGDNSATFTFDMLPADTYVISATWSALPNRTPAAEYVISDGGGSVLLDQRDPPSGEFDDGRSWAVLNTGVEVTDGTLVVTLTDADTEGFLLVDAVRVRPARIPGDNTWHLAAPGPLTSQWTDAANWTWGHVPTFEESVIVDSQAGWDFPVVSADAGQVADLSLAPDDDTIGNLTVAGAGRIEVSGVLSMGRGANSMAQMRVEGAVLADTIEMSYGASSASHVHVDAGFLACDTLDIGMGGVASLDIEPGALLYLTGDQMNAVAAWIDTGLITADDGAGVLRWNYHDTGWTVVSAAAAAVGSQAYLADFEDGEINPGRWPDSGVINTTPYSSTQPEAFSTAPGAEPDGDAFGWQNRAVYHVGGDTTIVDDMSRTGDNSAAVQNRTLRSDIEHELVPDATYTFTLWYYVPGGATSSIFNKVVVRDQTNDHDLVFTGNSDFLTVPAWDSWLARTVTFDTSGYTPATTRPDGTIDLRLGVWFAVPGAEGAASVIYTDNWSLSFVENGEWPQFGPCMSGPDNGPLDPACAQFDADVDDDTDIHDCAQYQAGFGG